MNNDFCDSWGDLSLIFTRDLISHSWKSLPNRSIRDNKNRYNSRFVTRENHQVTSKTPGPDEALVGFFTEASLVFGLHFHEGFEWMALIPPTGPGAQSEYKDRPFRYMIFHDKFNTIVRPSYPGHFIFKKRNPDRKTKNGILYHQDFTHPPTRPHHHPTHAHPHPPSAVHPSTTNPTNPIPNKVSQLSWYPNKSPRFITSVTLYVYCTYRYHPTGHRNKCQPIRISLR